MQSLLTQRARSLNAFDAKKGPVVYWMIRDMRAHDNWALLYAQQQALSRKEPLHVVFALRKDLTQHLGTARLLDALLGGLAELATQLHEKNIQFHLLLGEPVEEVSRFCKKHAAGSVVVDFSPLRPYRPWHQQLATSLEISVKQVDAHNVIPCWKLSEKQEYAARTIRPKVHKLLDTYLVTFPKLKHHSFGNSKPTFDLKEIRKKISVDETISMPEWFTPGYTAGMQQLDEFMSESLDAYDQERNDPTKDALSDLSPWLHFGHIAPARVALEVEGSSASTANKEAYLEELIVRRELSDNYCFYNNDYESPRGYASWALKTLNEHAGDEREFIYSLAEFESAQTHQPLWNAAQNQLLKTGKMHGYMRMYWAKKILEWSSDYTTAHETALYLNDLYSLDGRDPNGYVGVAWSIGGVHDRAWFEREVYGKIRYMNANGAKRKFDIKKYSARWNT